MKFIGIWTVTEDGTASAPSQYLVSVITGDEPAEVRIQNMNNKFTSPVIASVRQDSLFIPAQTIDNITIEGKGVLLTGGPNLSIRLFYKVTEAGQTNDYGFDSGNFSIWTR
ncbi:MAG: hypothetical protein EOP49_26810 [Sphingobacteriales bacterium]|nr:MAG: hypothetical protein EOP49_26810 [Sphingobacteriales bacterium]